MRQTCDPSAASWSCAAVAKSGLSLPQIEGGRVFSAGLSIGAELAGQRVETRVNAANDSEIITWAVHATATSYPIARAPIFVRLGAGPVRYRLDELNNGTAFRETGWGWGISAVVGADLAVTSAIAVGPFVRLDFIELRNADVFFATLQRRAPSLGVAVTLR
jgi:hypothetical protein